MNGHRIDGEHLLSEGDRIRFGPAGPEVEFRGIPASTTASEAAPLTTTSRRVSGAPETRAGGKARGGRSNASRAAGKGAARGAKTPEVTNPPAISGARRLLLLVFPLFLLAGAAVLALQATRRGALLEGERAALQQRIDSLTTSRTDSILALEGELRELSDALRASREEVRQASLQLEQAERASTSAEVTSPREQVDPAAAAGGRPGGGAGLDLLEIERINRHAVAVIWVEDETGAVSTGTAFAVRPDATLVTSRHVVAGEDGSSRPRRIAVQFSDSDQIWPARILVVGADVDLALVKVDNILGEVPTIRALNTRPDTLRAGTIVGSIGFPVGRAPAVDSASGRDDFASPLLTAGVVSATTPERLEFQGYSAAGASGSPVFDHTGAVVAVLFGGLTDTPHPTLVGVPATAIAALIGRIP